MGKHRKTSEILLSRPVARPLVKRRDGPLYPPFMPDLPGQTLAAFWQGIDATPKRPAPQPKRPRLLDPVQGATNLVTSEGPGEGQRVVDHPTASDITRRPSALNRVGAASSLWGCIPESLTLEPRRREDISNRGTHQGQTGHIKN